METSFFSGIERCATVRVPAAAAHYAITGEEVPVWDEHKGGYRDSRPSLHTVGLRSHYSFPRPLNPPPVPPPTFLPSLKRERHHYTGTNTVVLLPFLLFYFVARYPGVCVCPICYRRTRNKYDCVINSLVPIGSAMVSVLVL